MAEAGGYLLTFLAVTFAWVFFRATTLVGALRITSALVGGTPLGTTYASSGVLNVIGLPILIGDRALYLGGFAAVAVAIAIVLALPNAPRIFRYHEYRRAPEPASALAWRANAAWSTAIALMFAAALFGMWQRLEFLYFQF